MSVVSPTKEEEEDNSAEDRDKSRLSREDREGAKEEWKDVDEGETRLGEESAIIVRLTDESIDVERGLTRRLLLPLLLWYDDKAATGEVSVERGEREKEGIRYEQVEDTLWPINIIVRLSKCSNISIYSSLFLFSWPFSYIQITIPSLLSLALMATAFLFPYFLFIISSLSTV